MQIGAGSLPCARICLSYLSNMPQGTHSGENLLLPDSPPPDHFSIVHALSKVCAIAPLGGLGPRIAATNTHTSAHIIANA